MTDEKLDTSSTDALHWAEQFCKTYKEICRSKYPGRRPEIDVDWVQGWFANYWAAVSDPLNKEIEALRKQISAFQEKQSRLSKLLDDQMGTPCEQIRHEQKVEALEANSAFFKSCALSGEIPKEGAEPFPKKD